MENVTLEDILQKHFGLKGNLYLKTPEIVGYVGGNRSRGDFDAPSPEYRYYTKAGCSAYARFTVFLYDLSKHVSLHMNAGLGKEITRLVDLFDNYEYCSE